MIYFVFLVVYIVLWKTVIPKKFNALLVLTATASLFILSGLRSETVGTDTAGYLDTYEQLQSQSVHSVFIAMFNGANKDQIFYLFSKIIGVLGLNSQQYIGLLSAIYLSSFSLLVRKYSKDPAFSYLFLLAGGFLIFSYSGLRQAMAISITMIALAQFAEGKSKNFYFLVLFASLFHSSALIFLLSPIALNERFRRFERYIFIALIALVFLFQDFFRTLIFGLNLDRLSVYEDETRTLNASGFVLYLIIYIFCVFFRDKKDSFSNTLLSMALFGLALQAMSVIVAEFFRLAMYFNIIYAILLPRVFMELNPRSTRYIASVAIYLFFIAYFFYGNLYSDFELVQF